MAGLWGRTKDFFGNVKSGTADLFDPKGINRANVGYVQQQQAARAAGELGLTEAQKEAMVARGQEQVGAATSAALNQASLPNLSPDQRARLASGAISGLQATLAQQKMGADMASQEQAANRSAELNALEQGLFQRRKEKRDFMVDAAGKAIETGMTVGMAACWVAVALWGEEHPKTRLARYWCQEHDNAFTRAYTRHGQTWAGWVRRYRVARWAALPIWTALAYLGARHLTRETEGSHG